MKKKHTVWIGIGIFLVWACSAVAIYLFVDEEYRGVTGDMFGAVNALFSGLAFAGLIYTITVQRQELALQRAAIEMQTEELKMQREETARSADQLEGQKNLLNLQMAMSVVNDLIKTKTNRIEQLEVYLQTTWYKGNAVIPSLVRHYDAGIILLTEKDWVIKKYLDLFFYILQFIQDYELNVEQKAVLRELLNIETNDDELKLIYVAVRDNQHRLGLLKSAGFYGRHKELTEKFTLPSQ